MDVVLIQELLSEGRILSFIIVIVVVTVMTWFMRTGWKDITARWDQEREDRMQVKMAEIQNMREISQALQQMADAFNANAIELAKIEVRLNVMVASMERIFRLLTNGRDKKD